MTIREAIEEDAQGFNENRDAAIKGGKLAGSARETIEAQSGKKVVSSEHFLGLGKSDDKKELPPSE